MILKDPCEKNFQNFTSVFEESPGEIWQFFSIDLIKSDTVGNKNKICRVHYNRHATVGWISFIHTSVNIPALIRKRSVFLVEGPGYSQKCEYGYMEKCI